MGNTGTLEAAARQLGLALQPLQDQLSPVKALQVLAEAGLALPAAIIGNPGLAAALSNASNSAGGLSALLTALAARIASGDDAGTVATGAQLIQQIRSVFSSLDAISPALKAAGPVPGVSAPELAAFADSLPTRLLGRNMVSFLEDLQPSIVGIGNLLGVLDRVSKPGINGDPLHPPFVLEQLQLSKLADALQHPAALLKSLYGWGQPGFDGTLLMPRLATSLSYLGIPAQVSDTGTEVVTQNGTVSVLPGPIPGLTMTVSVPIISGVNITLPLTPTWTARAIAQGMFAEGLQIDAVPPATARMKPAPPAGPLNGGFSVELTGQSPSKQPLPILGVTGGSRLQTDSVTVGLSLQVVWDPVAGSARVDQLLHAEFAGAKAIIDAAGSDGFISKILGGASLEADLDLGLTYSINDGLRFRGGAALELQLAQHLTLGPVTVNNLALSLGIKDGAFPLAVTAEFQTSLGPLTALVKGMGFRITLKIAADNKGNLGPIDIQPGFQPPNGVGLELSAGGFTGGGFLAIDPAKGEYSGGLELMFLGSIGVRAVGILSTRLPDGSKGFSLLIILASEFPPIQLSYGFTLLAIGGLLGLNRTVQVDELQSGVRDGSLNSILFPADVVANAARIISDLKRIFPPKDGRFLVGPMAKLGWGTPTLISLSVGLILEIPRPLFAFVGVLHMALPADDLPILHLQVSFAGSIDFESGRVQFDASLYDSRVLTFTLTGDMALRVYWKDNANFLLSVGGFHPAYTPPPMNLGELARLGVVLFQGNPHVTAQVYFAVTSNSVQFGARVEVYYGISLFNVYGFLGLDVLINFNPFHFVAEIEAEIGVRSGDTSLFAITLQLTLEGPSPWHARGTGSFRIGFIIKVTISANFDVSFGDPQETHLESIDVLAEMVNALSNVGNWRPLLPENSNQHVTLRKLPDAATTLVMHPFGALEITQKLLPLHVAIQHFGTRVPVAGSTFTIGDVMLGAGGADVANTREEFAPAQFFNLSDAEKLSRPSFSDYDAGIVIGGSLAAQTDFMRQQALTYELIYIPEQSPFSLFFNLSLELAGAVAFGSAAAQSPVSHVNNSVSPLEIRASAMQESWAVVSTSNLTLHAPDLVFDNATAAHQAVQQILERQPEFFGAIQAAPMAITVRSV